MAITLAQAIPNNWTMTGVDVESNELTVTAGNSLLIGVILDNTATITVTSVAIEGESNATPVGSLFSASVASRVQRMQYFTLDEILNSGTKEIVIQLSAAGSLDAWAAELVGADLTGILDVDGGGASGNSTSASDGLTTGFANSAVFMFGNFAGSEGTADGDSTAFDLPNPWLYYGGQYDLDAGIAGAKTPTLTVSSGEWAVRSIAIKAAGGGAPAGQPARKRWGGIPGMRNRPIW